MRHKLRGDKRKVVFWSGYTSVSRGRNAGRHGHRTAEEVISKGRLGEKCGKAIGVTKQRGE